MTQFAPIKCTLRHGEEVQSHMKRHATRTTYQEPEKHPAWLQEILKEITAGRNPLKADETLTITFLRDDGETVEPVVDIVVTNISGSVVHAYRFTNELEHYDIDLEAA